MSYDEDDESEMGQTADHYESLVSLYHTLNTFTGNCPIMAPCCFVMLLNWK